jgi:hypothetical protein
MEEIRMSELVIVLVGFLSPFIGYTLGYTMEDNDER